MTHSSGVLIAVIAAMLLLGHQGVSAETVPLLDFHLLKQDDGTLFVAKHNEGSSSFKYDLVIMGDGYTLLEQSKFNGEVDSMVSQFLELDLYSNFKCAFNIWIVNVVAATSGIGSTSPLRCQLESNTASRWINGDQSRCDAVVAASGVPGCDAIFVMANEEVRYAAFSPDYGGITFVTSKYPYGELMGHELGHVIGDLADEYACLLCTTTEGPRDYTAGYAPEPNLTVLQYLPDGTVDRSKIPWNDLIGGWTYVPTEVLGSCYCGEIGAWEGGGTYASGVWRPQERCLMHYVCRYYGKFCDVCRREMAAILMPKCLVDYVYNPLGATYHKRAPNQPADILDGKNVAPVEKFDWKLQIFAARHIPPCWYCPPEIPTEQRLRVELSGLQSPDAMFTVVDDHGKILARSERAGPDTLAAEFDALGFLGYVLNIDTGPPTAKTLEIRSRITRNNHVQELR